MIVLSACGHTDPASVTPDRWSGPWQQGTTIQLFPNPVALLGFSADGHGLLIVRGEAPRVRPPYGPARRDTAEAFLTYLPSDGGSGVWDWSDDRPSQLDSLNNVTAAALSRGGRLLVQVATGPRGINHFPVLWHADLVLVRPLDPGDRRRLLGLFDEVDGHVVGREGELNWFTRLEWVGEDRFVGAGAHLGVGPSGAPVPLGLFAGTIRPDTTRIEPIDPLDGVQGWSVTADGQVLLRSGLDLLLRPAGPGERTHLATIPAAAGHSLLAARCDADLCWAITGTDASPYPDWEIWRIDRGDGSVQMTRTLSPNPLGAPILPPTGRWAMVRFNGVPYRIDDVLPDR